MNNPFRTPDNPPDNPTNNPPNPPRPNFHNVSPNDINRLAVPLLPENLNEDRRVNPQEGDNNRNNLPRPNLAPRNNNRRLP